MRYTPTIIALGLSATNVAATLDHPALWPNLDFIAGTLGTLPATSVKVSAWTNGAISKGCRDRAIADGKSPANMKQYSITYGDCGQVWYMCQESNAPKSITEVATNFGRLPVRMRQWTNNVVHYNSGSGAYAIGSDVVFFGNSATTAVMIHEATHCVDGGDGFYSMQSKDQEWVDAYNADSAVPDDYARTNQAENLAQFPGLIIYDRFTNGKLQSQSGLPKIGHELQKVADQGDWSSQYGGRVLDPTSSGLQCTRRWALSPAVNPSTGATVSGFAAESKTDDSIVVVSEPEGVVYTATNCTIH